MSKSSIKKISAAAIAAVLGFSAMSASQGATVFSDPNNPVGSGGQAYQQADTGSPTTFSPSGPTITTTGAGTTGSPDFSDFYPAPNALATPQDATTITPGSVLTINVGLTQNQAANATGFNPQFGINVIDGTGQTAAAFYIQYDNNGASDLVVSNGSQGEKQVLPGYDGNPATPGYATGIAGDTDYTLTLDPGNNTFFVQYAGQTYTGQLYASGVPVDVGGALDVSGVTLSSVDEGDAGNATYSNFSVVTSVPEPASMAMIGLGGVMLLAKRPKRRLA